MELERNLFLKIRLRWYRIKAIAIRGYSRNKSTMRVAVDSRISCTVLMRDFDETHDEMDYACLHQSKSNKKKSSERMRLILVTGVLSILCTEFKPFHLVADSIERENCIRWKPLVLRELTKSKINEKRDFEISWKTNRFDVFEEKRKKIDLPLLLKQYVSSICSLFPHFPIPPNVTILRLSQVDTVSLET